ncbi:heterogeneous nuclear ribonucleoprotein D0-like [Papaver somniferum]|uniref:heterogeneous nuclear ribonucleoprotein D0-like n=1 Tax=Papaver somniferum TaxID=3469 RepID=UPI000E703EC9|nr:heterogeneous nuclear ribonucleoprotein D0-like [Papaver somniferum]
MEASVSRALMESDSGETKVLEALIDAFSSEFSLREIASAYCKAGRDPDRAAEILYDGQKLKNCSNAASAVIATQQEANCALSSASSESLCESVDDKPSSANYWNSKASKTQKLSVGSVSGVIGEGNAMPNIPAWGPVSRIRPSYSEILGESVATKWGADESLKASELKNSALSVGSVSGVIGEGNAMPNTPAWGPVSRISPSLSETLGESVATNWGADEGLKASELKNSALSVGCVSGKCLICSRPACGPLGATKPLKSDMKDFRFDELSDDDVASDSTAKEDQMHKGQGRIFVGGLSMETNEDTLKDHFKKFGEVVEAVIIKHRDTRSLKGFGYVHFSDPSVADKVLFKRHVILGRLVGVEKAAPKPGVGHNNPYNQKGFSKKSSENDGQFRTKKIFVGGLPHSLTEEEFKAYFEKFGRTTDVVLPCTPSKDRHKGFGFVTFDSEEAVENVMQKRFHELYGKAVEVKRTVFKDGSNNGQNGGYHMRKNGGRGGSLSGGVQDAGINQPLSPGYGGTYSGYYSQLSDDDSAGGTPVVSPRSPL